MPNRIRRTFGRAEARVAILGALGLVGGVAVACGSSGSDDDGANGGDGSTVDPAGDSGPRGPSNDATVNGGDDSSTVDMGSDGSTDATFAGDDGGRADSGAGDADAEPGPPLLDAGASCTNGDQCASGGCDDTGHCALGRSCTQQNGGRTCGPDGGDNCCTAIRIPIPDGGYDAGEAGAIAESYTLDKYSVTAGRFRQFIASTDGGVRQYVQAHRPTWFDPGWDSFLPYEMNDGTTVDFDAGAGHAFVGDAGRDGVYQQLGPMHYGTEGPGNEGCLTKEVGNARTFRLPDAVNASLFGDVQQYSQADLDPKPMQCANFFMLAAFCIWDNGRLPTLPELDYAWDEGNPSAHTYPWGNTPMPAGWDFAFDTAADAKNFGKSYTGYAYDAGNQTFANYEYNWWSPATESCLGNDAAACDYSVFLAPPGRFPKGNGPFGHSDLVGSVYNVAIPPVSTSDPTTLAAGIAKSGAFDLHKIPQTHNETGLRNFNATNKYLAIGVRCAR